MRRGDKNGLMDLGLLLTALGFGLRHGIDWDHIAAIADLSSSAEDRKRGFWLSMAYAVGHGVVVFGLGTIAIAFGLAIPDSLDQWMGRVVGATLILLGVWILVELVRKGSDFRLRSRWLLVIDGTFAGLRRVRTSLSGRKIRVEHDHSHDHAATMIDLVDGAHGPDGHDHAHIVIPAAETAFPVEATVGESSAADLPAGWRGFRDQLRGHSHSGVAHSHRHSHELALADKPGAYYGTGTATGIGMLHGVGIESPTQIAIFVASTAVAGVGFGIALLATWVVGLIIANAALAIVAGAGFLNAERSFPIYATVAVIVSVLSIALGMLYIVGLDVLPALS